jgi:hypothetical protein
MFVAAETGLAPSLQVLATSYVAVIPPMEARALRPGGAVLTLVTAHVIPGND